MFVEPCGFNAEKDKVKNGVQRLIVKDQVDVIVCPLNTALADIVGEVHRSDEIPLIMLTMGEDLLLDADLDPYLFSNSFNAWQSTWLMGYWAAENIGKTACTLASIHDGGYNFGFAFALGYEAAEGSVLQIDVTHRESRTEDPRACIENIFLNNPEFIFGYYSGKESVSFLNAYRELEVSKNTPLLGLPFIVDESLLDELGEKALGIKTMSSWSGQGEKSESFIKNFTGKTDKVTHAHALLAYEAGQIIAEAVYSFDGAAFSPSKLRDALAVAECEGPRGALKFNDKNEIETKDYLREVVMNEDGKLVNKVIETITPPDLYFEQLVLAKKNLEKQGWLNPYLCA